MARLSVNTSFWLAFPVSAVVRVFRGQKDVATSLIEAHEVNGLYPGDVWAFDATRIE